ncbi:MAG: MotA/TolQ/ExbB proton channel family protein [bacterium]
MKKLLWGALAALIITQPVAGDELSEAYQREYAYLKAQKNELQTRLAQENREQERLQAKARRQIERLQSTLLDKTTAVQTEQELLTKMQTDLSEVQDNSEITDGVLMQMSSSMTPYGYQIDESEGRSKTQQLESAFDYAARLLQRLGSMHSEPGAFFLQDGSKAEGQVVSVGNIARFGVSANGAGALAPAGGGEFKLWPQPGSSDTARALANGEMPESLDIFVYENPEQEIPDPEEKTLLGTVESGGIVGFIILGLGALGLLLVVFRVIFLMRAGTNVERITQVVVDDIENCRSEAALGSIKGYKGAVARVMRSILRNLKSERAHLEDIVTESILNESASLDRFGALILVIAAVAPLLGLLGTVGGMISTFDVITQFGTGDPKLLSGGISVALVTTMLGLIVAIPLLLLGNLLSGWAQNIKDSLERNALRVINIYEKSKRTCSPS